MQKTGTLIRTKLRLPFTRAGLVPRPRLQQQVAQGLCGPLTLITAPAGFGKTTLVASFVTGCGMPVAWLSLDRDDNQAGRFLNYLVAALQQADNSIGGEAAQLLSAARQAPPEAILASLINDLDAAAGERVLVLDDYQVINNQTVHEEVAFLLEHCPRTLHLAIATRSDPPLPLTRLRARGQMLELRHADLGFTEPEAAQFLTDVMGLDLDAGSIAILQERTEGWIAGLQMAALALQSLAAQGTPYMPDRQDVAAFIAGFSGTNRYILDYLLEEVLASQSPETQHFLLYTSILERLTAPLCDAVIGAEGIRETGMVPVSPIPDTVIVGSQAILEYLERANLFLIPLDDERIWYRYHHLFADLLRAQLQKSLGAEGIARLHVCVSEWHELNGSILDAIHHASAASDDKRVERLIEQHYMEMVSRGEMSGMRLWRGRLSKELVYRRPWLCIYEAYSHAWFGELDEADRLLDQAEKRIRSEISTPDTLSMHGHLAYVRSRVTAMRGNIHRAIEFCLAARENIPASNLALQFDTQVTLGYEYFLHGDYANASQILNEAIRTGTASAAIIHTVAASCMMARLYANLGRLQKSYDTYRTAANLIPEGSDEHRDATALVEAGMADVLCEWNDLDAALVHLEQGLTLLPLWAKVDDLILAYMTLARIHRAQGSEGKAAETIDQATHLIQTNGVFSEARNAVETSQVELWLAQGDLEAANRWAVSRVKRSSSDDLYGLENELAHIAQARVFVALDRPNEAIALLSHLAETARSAGRMGRVIEILLLEALALRDTGDSEQALRALTECLTLAEPEGYVRVFLDEGQSMQTLLAQWLAHAGTDPLQGYALHLLSQFDAELQMDTAIQEEAAPAGDPSASSEQALVEPLSPRELEVLHLIALGRTNKEIAQQLVVAPGTVKAHTSSIYRKLDVANRTEAVACARQLGILP